MWQPQGIFSEYVLRRPAILAGEEAVKGLYNYPGERIAVIHEPFFTDFELFNNTFRKKTVLFCARSWNGEPDLNGLAGTLKEITYFKPDTFIAVGGGSVIDGTKLCRLFYEIPYYSTGSRIDGNLLKTQFIVIPTTIGSGAEVSSAAVYVEAHHKQMIVIHEMQPDVVVFDKRYVENTPKRILFASALDTLSHIVEGYVSNINNVITDMEAENGLRILKEETVKMLEDKEPDYLRLQYAGHLGGIVQNHCIVGATHGIAHQLTAYGFSHGEAVALLIAAVIRNNSMDKKTADRYDELCIRAGLKEHTDLIDLIDRICEKAGFNERKAELGKLLVSKENDEAFMDNIRNDRGGKGNPLEMNDEYLKKVFRSL